MVHIRTNPTETLVVQLLRHMLKTRIKMHNCGYQANSNYKYGQPMPQSLLDILVDGLLCCLGCLHFYLFIFCEIQTYNTKTLAFCQFCVVTLEFTTGYLSLVNEA